MAIEDVAQVASAAGTLAAAVFAARAARAAREGLDQAERPLLLDVRPWWSNDRDDFPHGIQSGGWVDAIKFDPTSGKGTIPVRNVGPGVAAVNSFGIVLSEHPADAWWQGSTEALPPGEDVELLLEPEAGSAFVQWLQEVPSPLHGEHPLIVYVQYTDLDGEQAQTLELVLKGASHGDRTYLVHRRHRRDGYVVRD